MNDGVPIGIYSDYLIWDADDPRRAQVTTNVGSDVPRHNYACPA
jgi:hypothetical protein